MNNTAQAWEIARDIAAHQGTGSKEWYGLAHLILTLPARIEVIEEPIDDGEPCQLTNSQVKRLIAQLDDAQLSERIEPTVEENEMNELIPLQTTDFNGDQIRTVYARDLHVFLGVQSEFRNWIKNRIEQFGFVQDVDFIAGNFLPGSERIEPTVEENEMNELTVMTSATMTSKEIADLVESRHDSVKRTVERLSNQHVISQPPLVDGTKSANGVIEQVYLFDAARKRDTFVVVAQLSPEFTGRIVDRWIELEAQVTAPAPALPNFTDPAAAARAWANEYEQKTIALAQLEAAQPAIEFHERVADDDGLHSIDELAKVLQAPPMKLRAALKNELHIFRLDGLPLQQHINNGFMRVIETALPNGRIYPQPMFTGKGMIWIQHRIDHELMGVRI